MRAEQTRAHFRSQVILAWSLYMLVASVRIQLPWETCGNAWNSKNCTLSTANVELRCAPLGNASAAAGAELLTSTAASTFTTIAQPSQSQTLLANSTLHTLFSIASNPIDDGVFSVLSAHDVNATRFRSTSGFDGTSSAVPLAHEWMQPNASLNCTNVSLRIRSPAEEYF